LAGLQLDLSSVNTSNLSHGGSQRVGEIKVGDVEYDIFAECIPVIKNKQKSTRLNSLELSPETNEIAQLNPLLPSQRKNPQETKVLLGETASKTYKQCCKSFNDSSVVSR
jgi:hypothetical protein